MAALLLLALLLAAVATLLALRAATTHRVRSARTVAQIESYTLPAPVAAAGRRTPFAAAVDRAAARLGRALLRDDREDGLRALLLGAGLYRTTPGKFLGYRVLAVLAAAGLWGWLWQAGLDGAPGLLAGVVLLVGAWVLPKADLRRRRDRRLAQVDRELPELVDFLVVTVEAGIGFTSALHAAAKRFRAPLGDELRLTIQEQSMGLSTEESLRNLLLRCETPMLRSFVRSLVQGELLGVSIGQILRELAVEMRKRRRQAAEEQAHKAPVKMLFPLALLIFPSLFLILLGPVVYQIVRTLGGH